jgi:hypothetical protein
VSETVTRNRVGAPSGPITTPNPRRRPFGVDWAQVNRWDGAIQAAAAECDVPVDRVKAHLVIESQGVPGAIQKNDANGWSFGLMQVVPRHHRRLILRLAGVADGGQDERAVGQLLLDDPDLAVRAGAAVLRAMFDHQDSQRLWDRASSKFFLGVPDWFGEDPISRATGAGYRDCLNGLIDELGRAAGDDQPFPFEEFDAPRTFRVRDGVRATGRERPTRRARIVEEFGAGTEIACDGVFRGEAVEGNDRWLRTSEARHLAIHVSALLEAMTR